MFTILYTSDQVLAPWEVVGMEESCVYILKTTIGHSEATSSFLTLGEGSDQNPQPGRWELSVLPITPLFP